MRPAARDGSETETTVRAIPRSALSLMAPAWLLVLGALTPIVGQQRGFQPEDYYDIVTVDAVAVSPAGDLVAFTVTHVLEEENHRQRELWMQPLENGRPDGEAYRFTDPTEDSYSPIWSLRRVSPVLQVGAWQRRQLDMVRPGHGSRR